MSDLEESRERNFQAKIKRDHGDIYLSVTHNGHQWHGISLNHREMVIVKEILSQELESHLDGIKLFFGEDIMNLEIALRHINSKHGTNWLMITLCEISKNYEITELQNAIEMYWEMRAIWNDAQISAKEGSFSTDEFVADIEYALRKRFKND